MVATPLKSERKIVPKIIKSWKKSSHKVTIGQWNALQHLVLQKDRKLLYAYSNFRIFPVFSGGGGGGLEMLTLLMSVFSYKFCDMRALMVCSLKSDTFCMCLVQILYYRIGSNYKIPIITTSYGGILLGELVVWLQIWYSQSWRYWLFGIKIISDGKNLLLIW